MTITNSMKSKFDYGPWGQQYCPPFCYELAGKKLSLVFDQERAAAEFIDEKVLRWCRGGKTDTAEYWTLKLCNDIYLVSFGIQPEICVTLVIDMTAGLITLDETSFDENRAPYKSALAFGAIEEHGKPLPKNRHSFTDDLVGNCIKWVFCDTYWHVEGYEEKEMFYFSNYPDFKGKGPYRAVKISDTVYYSLNGDAKESMSVLMDMTRLFSVSRSVVYGNGGKAIPLGAIGSFEENCPEYFRD